MNADDTSRDGQRGTTPPTGPAVVLLDGGSDLPKSVLGGKAWAVNRMASMDLPVPPAFCLPTTCCEAVNAAGGLTATLRAALRDGIAHIEERTGRVFGGGPGTTPLLVSVRSGAAVSMPGMMDTVLNLGLNQSSSRALTEQSGDAAWVDSLVARFRSCFLDIVAPAGGIVPEDPWAQLEAAVTAVFASWHSPRARAYRAHHGITELAGTAVTVQAMVFGNLDDQSGTGVVFSRNPITGDRAPYGEWLARAQGEDVVSGSTTPQRLATLAHEQPTVHSELTDLIARLETDAGEVQDVEFTVESGRLWVLQTRAAKRSPEAAVRLAVALAEDGLITRAEALTQVSAEVVRRSGLTTAVATETDREPSTVLAQGEPAGPGRVTGLAVGDPDEAADLIDAGEDVVLVRPTTSPDDVHGMFGAVAVVTDLGGSTSHAALVSRELGIACVVGCGEGTADRLVGKTITVDGGVGRIYEAASDTEPPPEARARGSEDADVAVVTLTAWAREALRGASVPETALDGLDLAELLDLLVDAPSVTPTRTPTDTEAPA